ncbi:MAG: ATP-dependent Clp protease proteolytic subunit [Peptococcaceae bacterium]|nr:ATP-dependent Clp protease proteolytic subunit [Peptococcaceae bacterium]
MDKNERIKLLRQLESQRNSKVLVYFSYTPLDDNILMPLYSQLVTIGKTEKIDLFLHSYGGAVDTPFKVVTLIREFCDKFGVIVPFVAKSAASMIAIGADEIVMGPVSELGPIDPLVKHPLYKELWIPVQAIRYCLDYIQRTIQENPEPDTAALALSPIMNKLDPWIIGDYEKAIKASKQYAQQLLASYMFKNQPEKIEGATKALVEGYFSHGYPIGRKEAKEELGLNIVEATGELWQTIWELYTSYDEIMVERDYVSIIDYSKVE